MSHVTRCRAWLCGEAAAAVFCSVGGARQGGGDARAARCRARAARPVRVCHSAARPAAASQRTSTRSQLAAAACARRPEQPRVEAVEQPPPAARRAATQSLEVQTATVLPALLPRGTHRVLGRIAEAVVPEAKRLEGSAVAHGLRDRLG
eukprot:CAMPEP_0119405934 /NCGR_PEP_ID=MMETSP1335-20130426/452_1 /TAXON_ID=259385 /ORGANISM="Chrysoculter rhomboideus, Strain RCC1486" /LENGTH=148 /DNA_ID=CAMNT_0007429983 /DNA_START=207 /DNA_END=651 /DNA_ORIENTATION=+